MKNKKLLRFLRYCPNTDVNLFELLRLHLLKLVLLHYDIIATNACMFK
jgi:hypothetical protein